MTNPTTPHNAAHLLDSHLSLIGTDIERWLELFAEDAVVEFPYARSLDLPERLEGREAIRRYFQDTPKSFLGLTFSCIQRHVTADPDVALAEAHGSATIAATGSPYEQDYVMMVKTRNGRISLYREYWNPVPGLKAFGGEENLRRAVNAS
ncbi:nuclear transport factor 2 family protein [Vitiosangium sp. GDMCC 1.1324]|uniref:nuclear transport factor 2 family protein n=1 Tax=Vitiosangium sp. (strain GDMCC 1.1324) TaxID=2138576 RepID=UPI000D38E02D|nr:nuclear transport factor 2 family protein [Vitiosangium sp. GDMCC 1.1324]PTL84056.1 phenazine biosynthesis protein [Vitiosangium sp. GDMCC 1.1324]